jgi:hypothetical protein
MLEKRIPGIDRRSQKDRRSVYDLDYFFSGGAERRGWIERRSQAERRVGWKRVDKWASHPMGGLKHQM